MLTETPNPRSTNIDRLPTLDILKMMNDEDATVAITVQRCLPLIAQAVDTITRHLRQGGRLFYIGAGTSGRLGVLDAAECVPTFGIEPEKVQGIIAGGSTALTEAAEGAEDDYDAGRETITQLGVTAQDVVVGIAASGRTPYVIGALEAANAASAATIAIACNEPAPMLEAAGIAISAVVGPEIIAGSTRLKAGTAQKMILNMLSTATMIRLGKVYGNLMVDVKVTNQKLATRARGIVERVAGVSADEAERLLIETRYQAKPAIVMALCHVSAEEARRRLKDADGMLHLVIDQHLPNDSAR